LCRRALVGVSLLTWTLCAGTPTDAQTGAIKIGGNENPL
jgi:hypothetical protein